jgi:hypothetical protein
MKKQTTFLHSQADTDGMTSVKDDLSPVFRRTALSLSLHQTPQLQYLYNHQALFSQIRDRYQVIFSFDSCPLTLDS